MRFTIWRGAFVSVALAYGRWCRRISDRTGHPSGATIAKDERHQTFSELVLGELVPFVEALPELQVAQRQHTSWAGGEPQTDEAA